MSSSRPADCPAGNKRRHSMIVDDGSESDAHPSPVSMEEEGSPQEVAASSSAPAPPFPDVAAAARFAALRDEVFLHKDLLPLILKHLCIDDICRAAGVRRYWREQTSSPMFWEEIDLRGHNITAAKLCQLLRLHPQVRRLNARSVALTPADMEDVFPRLTGLESLAMDGSTYNTAALQCISTALGALTELTLGGAHISGGGGGAPAVNLPPQAPPAPAPPPHLLHAAAGGDLEWGAAQQHEVEQAMLAHMQPPGHLEPQAAQPPPPLPATPTLSHPSLTKLTLRHTHASHLVILCPALTHLNLDRCHVINLTLGPTPALEHLHAAGNRANDTILKQLLRITPGSQQVGTPLQALTSLHFETVPSLSDEIVSTCATGHPTLERLTLHSCSLLTGAGLQALGGWPALRHLHIASCESITGENLSSAVMHMKALEQLSLTGSASVTSLHLHSTSLRRVRLVGTRALAHLETQCPSLEELSIRPLSPGMAASHALKSVSLTSAAVRTIRWAAFPALRKVRLQCPNLETLDLSECGALGDDAFETLSGGVAGGGGCPRLRVLHMADCDGIKKAVLASPALEEVHFTECRRLYRAELDCPRLASVCLKDCKVLEELSLRTQRMERLSLGTCPQLREVSLQAAALHHLDLQGCGRLACLDLHGCQALLTVDASFCRSLGEDAMRALATCSSLQELRLGACAAVGAGGIAALAEAPSLRLLDLCMTPLLDPGPLAYLCSRLTYLDLSKNDFMPPQDMHAMLGVLCATPAPAHAPTVQELVVSFCDVPSRLLSRLATAAQLTSLAASGCSGVTNDLWPLLHRPAASPPPPAHATLRALSLVGSKNVETFYLGMAPAGEAAARGLALSPPDQGVLPTLGAGELAAQGFVTVDTPLAGVEELRMGVCHGLRRAAIALPALRELHLNGCRSLTELHLKCASLHRLSLSLCVKMTGEGVAAAVAGCPALRELDLQYHPLAAHPEALAALHAACPGLAIVTVVQRRR